MDPNANLAEQRALAAMLLEAYDNDRPILPAQTGRLAELVIALDNWIMAGGALPTGWRR